MLVIDHAPVEAAPPTLAPDKVSAEPAQTDADEPAFTVEPVPTVRTTVEVTAVHAPAGSSVVKVRVTVPVFPEIGVNTTLAGVAVCAVLLNWLAFVVIVPVAAVIDHAPVEAAPPMLAPVKV